MQAVINSAARGEKRNYLDDARVFLPLTRVRWTPEFLQTIIPNKPTIAAANHFARYPWNRGITTPTGYIATTQESFITSAIIAVELNDLSQRNVKWLAKGDLQSTFVWRIKGRKMLSIELQDRKAQQATFACYNFIPVRDGNGIQVMRETEKAFGEGQNLAIFPQGKVEPVHRRLPFIPSHTLTPYHEGFVTHLELMGRRKIDYQVLPVSIWFEDGELRMVFGKVINPNENPRVTANDTMLAIASKLPRDMQGPMDNLTNAPSSYSRQFLVE